MLFRLFLCLTIISALPLTLVVRGSPGVTVTCNGSNWIGECSNFDHTPLSFSLGTTVTVRALTTAEPGQGGQAEFEWALITGSNTKDPRRIFTKPLDEVCFADICYATTDSWKPDKTGSWYVSVIIYTASGGGVDVGICPGFQPVGSTCFVITDPPPPPPPPPPSGVGGVAYSVDKFSLLAPYIVLGASFVVILGVAGFYVKRAEREDKK